jgi:rod shape-determining protein MreD
MGAAFAAVGAGVAALLEVTVASRYQIAGAQLQMVLVLAIALTIAFSFEVGIAWAFVGGLFADLLVVRPLGASVFSLLIAVGGTAALVRFSSFGRLTTALVSSFAMTLFYVIAIDVIVGILRPPAYPLHLTSLFWAGVVNAAFGVVATLLVFALKRRLAQRQRLIWRGG